MCELSKKHFAELDLQHGGKTAGIDMIWRNYVTVTLCTDSALRLGLLRREQRRRGRCPSISSSVNSANLWGPGRMSEYTAYVNTTREHGYHFGHPSTRAVESNYCDHLLLLLLLTDNRYNAPQRTITHKHVLKLTVYVLTSENSSLGDQWKHLYWEVSWL